MKYTWTREIQLRMLVEYAHDVIYYCVQSLGVNVGRGLIVNKRFPAASSHNPASLQNTKLSQSYSWVSNPHQPFEHFQHCESKFCNNTARAARPIFMHRAQFLAGSGSENGTGEKLVLWCDVIRVRLQSRLPTVYRIRNSNLSVLFLWKSLFWISDVKQIVVRVQCSSSKRLYGA